MDQWDDAVAACADLVGRTGASGFEMGFLHDDVPVEEAGWYAIAQYRGTKLMSDDHRSPGDAAVGLAHRLLRGATCRCGLIVTLTDARPGCRWRLMGARWEPSCDAPPVTIAQRGDVTSIMEAGNRAARRAAARRNKGH